MSVSMQDFFLQSVKILIKDIRKSMPSEQNMKQICRVVGINVSQDRHNK